MNSSLGYVENSYKYYEPINIISTDFQNSVFKEGDYYFIINNSFDTRNVQKKSTDKTIIQTSPLFLNNNDSTAFVYQQNIIKDEEISIKNNTFEKEKILSLIQDSPLEWGEISVFDNYVIQNKRNNNLIRRLEEIFIENINDEDTVVKIFRALSNLTYDEVYPTAQTMCIAALTIDNYAIDESAVNLLENWRNETSLKLLKSINNIKAKWLKDYIDKIIIEIERELNINNGLY